MIDNCSLENTLIPSSKLCGSNQSPGVLQCICRFILSQQSKIYRGLVEYIDGTSVGAPRTNKTEGDKAFTKDNCCDDVRRSSQCDKLTLTIETLFVGENCLEHCGDNQLPVYVMEQWTAQVLPQNPKNRGISISDCQIELLDYIQTSPLMTAIKEPGRPRRYKLTHRSYVCDRISHVGDSFLMDASDILSMDCLSDRNKNSQDDDHDGSSISKIVRQMDGCESPIKRVFTPVCISEKELLHINVVTLKHLPQQFLGCPLCLDPTYLTNKDNFTMLSRARCYSPETLVDLDVCKKNSTLVSHITYGKPNVHPPNFLNLPKCSSNEVVRSPIVVMADTEERFMQSTFDNPFYNILPPCSSWDCTESGHSTLTKKSSRLTDSNRIYQIPLESPPRKQQRISCYAHELTSETKDSDDSNELPSSVTPTINKTPGVQREGCINKVIAEFTLLNVERDLIMNSVDDSNLGSACIPPVNACFSSFDVHRDSIQCNQLSYSTAKKRDHASESQLSTDSENSVLLTSPSASSQPVPRLSRRRNATSASVWPSSFHNDGTPFFNRRTGLPLQSSPVPLKRSTSGKFDFDLSLNRMKTSRSSICMVYNHNLQNSSDINTDHGKEPSSGVDVLKSDRKFSSATVPTDNNSSDNNENSSHKSNQTMTSFRRRPSSLRFTSQYQEQSYERNTISTSIVGSSNNRHTLAGARRRNYPIEINSTELSCSAPPSGGRSFQPHKNITNRLANTMACTPVPHGSSQHLLVNFEESMLNGRIHPVGQVEGFSIELGASGSFYPNHIRLPMKAYFFNLSDDNAPSPYLGYADLKQLPNNKGYHIPKKGSIQLTLFNPTGLVVKMFVIVYDLADMPPNCQTFLRQRTVYMPIQQQQQHHHHHQFDSSQMISNQMMNTTQSTSSTCPLYKPQHSSTPCQTTTTHTQMNHLDCTNSLTTSMLNPNVSVNTSSNCTTDHLWNISSKSLTEPNTPFLSFSSQSSSSCSCSSIASICSLSSYGSQNAVNNTNNTTTNSNTTHTTGISLNTRNELPAYLRYLVHLRFHTTRSGKLYLHTDLRLIFSRDKFEFDPRIATYELRSFIDAPSNPRYSPKKWSTRQQQHHHHHQYTTKYRKSINH
uniref:DUF4210 domain-containing protein n=1 Tax=Schistosoma mansoni TaxID=6183 RepID=A0A5K4F3B9_SCHMA